MVGAASQEADTIRRKESALSRRSYSREFKLSAVKLVNHQGYTVTEAAESLGVDPQNLRNWIKEVGPEVGKAPSDEPSRLREELRQPGRQENNSVC